jgi:DNA phosphorothioation-dependent restriction protein DptG
LACSKFGYTYDEANGLRKDKSRDRTNWIAQRVEDYSSRQQAHGRPATEKESKEQTCGAVREMFPKIPEADLTSIVNHAFEEVFL